jgi:VWFA-related protein
MRPEGCQETHPLEKAGTISCNSHISNQFLAQSALTLPKTQTYTHLMTGRRIFGATVVLLTVVLLQAPAPLAQAVQRSIYVSVLNAAGAPVPDLEPADFLVREDNLSREVLKVGTVDTPLSVALMVDTSAASRNNIRDIREAAIEFIKGVTGTDVKHQVALIGIGERPTVLVDYTSDQARLLKGIGLVFTHEQSGAYLLDGVIEASQGFKKREAQRPVIVAIATRGPEFSNRYHDQVLSALNGAGASFHIVMIGPPPADLTTNEGRERALTFSMATEASGGRYDNVLAGSAMPDRLKQVANELTHQYLVTYARPQMLIPPEKITIAAKRTDLVVRGTPVKSK